MDCCVSNWRKSRKEHVCMECGGKILPKEYYHIISGIYDDEPFTNKRCAVCWNIIEGIDEYFNDDNIYPLFEYLMESEESILLRKFIENAEFRGAKIEQWAKDKLAYLEAMQLDSAQKTT